MESKWGKINLGDGEVTKASVRQRVWEYLEKNDIANFPRPVYHRIPNFKGAQAAGQLVTTLPEFQAARTVKVSPDKPQEEVRYQVLEHSKDLIVPTPGLSKGLFNRLFSEPDNRDKERLRQLASRKGIDEMSKPVPMASRLKIDLVVVGSVAVDTTGRRLGKGEGFTDMEFAMAASHHGAVGPDTVVVTTVHDVQVFDQELLPEHLFSSHDLTVDIIVTPTKIFRVKTRLPKPEGIIWKLLSREKFDKIPILKEIQYREMKAGKEVRLRDDPPQDLNGKSESAKRHGQNNARRPARGPKQDQPIDPTPVANGIGHANEKFQTQKAPRQKGAIGPPSNKPEANHVRSQHGVSNGKTVAVFIGRIPRFARVKDLKEALCEKPVRVANLVWKGPKGFAFAYIELEPGTSEENLCQTLQGLKIGETVLNVELDRKQHQGPRPSAAGGQQKRNQPRPKPNKEKRQSASEGGDIVEDNKSKDKTEESVNEQKQKLENGQKGEKEIGTEAVQAVTENGTVEVQKDETVEKSKSATQSDKSNSEAEKLIAAVRSDIEDQNVEKVAKIESQEKSLESSESDKPPKEKVNHQTSESDENQQNKSKVYKSNDNPIESKSNDNPIESKSNDDPIESKSNDNPIESKSNVDAVEPAKEYESNDSPVEIPKESKSIKNPIEVGKETQSTKEFMEAEKESNFKAGDATTENVESNQTNSQKIENVESNQTNSQKNEKVENVESNQTNSQKIENEKIENVESNQTNSQKNEKIENVESNHTNSQKIENNDSSHDQEDCGNSKKCDPVKITEVESKSEAAVEQNEKE